MRIKIEEAFNQCFERLSAGESLDSCLRDYPQYAAKLDLMLRTTYDVKRRAYPIQPRPEFKHWAKVRLQGVQDYAIRQPVYHNPTVFNLRRNLAISMAALLVFVIASSGTVAASSESLPDEPLYGVKLAVEQAQVTFAFSNVDKAEVYAHLAEKRAGEIVAMAQQGKTDKIVTTTARMNYQLDQAEQFISTYEEDNAGTASGEQAAYSAPSATSAAPSQTMVVPPAKSTSVAGVTDRQQEDSAPAPKPATASTREATNINRAKNTMNTTTANSLTALQNAFEKAPDSTKPALLEGIQRTKKANDWAQHQLNLNNSQQSAPHNPSPNITPTIPADKQKSESNTNNKPGTQNVPPTGGTNSQTNTINNNDKYNNYNQTNTTGNNNHDNIKDNQTQAVPNLRLPNVVNSIVK